MARARLTAGLAIVAVFLSAESGQAWGRQGHRIVARIAAKNLTPDTRAKLTAILGAPDAELETAMALASIWPDLIDKKRTGTSNWHFVDAPVFSPFSVAGLCVGGDCVIDQIDAMRRRLQTNQRGFRLLQPPDPARGMTSQQLAFLIHFVGDVHQPLHAAGNGDRGGNCLTLSNGLVHDDGSPMSSDLHAVWDTDVVLAVMQVHGNEARTAANLFQRFRTGAAVTQASPLDWARESNELARTIYQALGMRPRSAAPGQCASGLPRIAVSERDLRARVADVEQRLMRAGIRLSNMLNDICKGEGCKARP
jgi:hypothetical protein